MRTHDEVLFLLEELVSDSEGILEEGGDEQEPGEFVEVRFEGFGEVLDVVFEGGGELVEPLSERMVVAAPAVLGEVLSQPTVLLVCASSPNASSVLPPPESRRLSLYALTWVQRDVVGHLLLLRILWIFTFMNSAKW